MKCFDPAALRVRSAGRNRNGRRCYRVETLGRALITGTRAEIYRWLRPRLHDASEAAALFREVA